MDCDTSGRFRPRPYYTDSELEQICEDAICGFLRERHGKAVFPVSTADLTVLIEQHVDDLDSYSDLEDGIDGLTHFFPKKKPKVKIASRLQEAYLENRLRTTLTHEHGHVLRCLRCLLLVMCTHPFAKKALTLHLARSEGHERYFGCNLMRRKVLASSHQHLMAEEPTDLGTIRCSQPATSYLSPSARCAPVNGLAGLLRFYHREAAWVF